MIVNEIAHYIALLPIAFVGALHIRHKPRDAAWWWIAAAFAVSWLADLVAEFMPVSDRWAVTLVYPVTQSALVGAVLLPRRSAMSLVAVLTAIALVAAICRGVTGPDVVLHSFASFSVAGIALAGWELPVRLRAALLVYFGLGCVAWLIHAQWLVVPTWYNYQLTRLAGLVAFCWAAFHPSPQLRLIGSRA